MLLGDLRLCLHVDDFELGNKLTAPIEQDCQDLTLAAVESCWHNG